ncbi:MAG: helix-turn-helix domain-containing protein [Solirubrobacterales bacterium]
MPRRLRSPEDDAAFLGMGRVIAQLRERRRMRPEELAERIEEDARTVERLERGEVNADWATLRVVAQVLAIPLDSLIELAEESAPGEGGQKWRQWSREAEARRDDG